MHSVSTPELRIRRWILLAKIAILFVPLVLVIWLVQRNMLLGVPVTFALQAGHVGSTVQLERPTELVATPRTAGGLRWVFAGDRLRFSALFPRVPERVFVRARLRNDDQPVVVLAAQGRREFGVHRTLVTHRTLNELLWNQISVLGGTLWQREPTFDSAEAFLRNPPTGANVGLLGFPEGLLVRVPGYRTAEATTELPVTLRGRHTLLVYVENETLDVEVQKVDLNRTRGGDPLSVSVDDPTGTKREFFTVPDDGDTGTSSRNGAPQLLRIQVPGMPTGVARIEFMVSDDALLTGIRSAQRHLTFEKQVFFADGPAYVDQKGFQPVSMRVEGTTLSVRTLHDEGLQRFTVNQTAYALREVKRPESVHISGRPRVVVLPAPDAVVKVDGRITLDPALPVPAAEGRVLRDDAEFDPEGLQFILARYVPHRTVGTLQIGQENRGSELQQSGGRFHFWIEAPGLRTDSRTLELKGIDVTMDPVPVRWSHLGSRVGQLLRKFLLR